MKNFFFGALLAMSAVLSFTACKDDEETPKNIVELAQSDANLSTLVEAVVYADLATTLSGTTEYTVFAPTNAAFSALLQSLGVTKITDVDKATVKAILLNHVVAGEVKSSAITTGYVKSASPFGTTTSTLSLYLAKSSAGVTINKDVNVTTADLDASNGVVHVVDKVIALPTVVNHALNNPNFSTLVAALTRSDLGVDYVTLLSGAGPFTVFAPTNDAFTALLTELGVANLAAIDAATLNKVLQYHVVSGANVLAATLTEGQQVTTFQSGKFTINLAGGAKIKDLNNRTSNIIITDVQGTNGVVHAIDKVLLPTL
ncbi:MAG: fasciclin domain-containing protein [Saprospiraceae bacterium]|nr:fasciclin domain-containing protein [Saprospiraceae bacterium]